MVSITDTTDRPRMDSLVHGLSTKSAKIRALDRADYSRSEIAKFLGIRYQHVRNVLVQTQSGEVPVQVGAGGRIVIPLPYREALGIGTGDELIVHLERDGLRISTRRAALRAAQEAVRKYVPEGTSLVDELISERRREAEKDDVHE